MSPLPSINDHRKQGGEGPEWLFPYQGDVGCIDSVLLPATGVKILVNGQVANPELVKLIFRSRYVHSLRMRTTILSRGGACEHGQISRARALTGGCGQILVKSQGIDCRVEG